MAPGDPSSADALLCIRRKYLEYQDARKSAVDARARYESFPMPGHSDREYELYLCAFRRETRLLGEFFLLLDMTFCPPTSADPTKGRS